MPFKVGVSTGLYMIARSEEISTTIRKIGYALTRGTSVIEISGDVPHEVTETEGQGIRYIINKQGLEVGFHGSLTIPMCVPERGDWRDAHDHLQKSIISAVYSGAKYMNVHSCLNIWLELMTYTSRKLTMAFVDHEGHFISTILKENEKLRKWFIKERGDLYMNDILDRDENTKLRSNIEQAVDKWFREQLSDKLRKRLNENDLPPELRQKLPPDVKDRVIEAVMNTRMPPGIIQGTKWEDIIRDTMDEIRQKAATENVKIQQNEITKALDTKLKAGKRWYSEELRAVVGIIDGYHIMAHHLYFLQDPMWEEIAKMYKDLLCKYKKVEYKGKEYKYPDGEMWLDGAWQKAETNNDRQFKEFFYGVVGAKFLEGHMKKILEWMDETLINKILAGNDELINIAKNLKLTIESPDARDATHAGLFLLWHPKQIYAAVKTLRRILKTDRVWLLMDFEHVATQGLDPIKEMEKITKTVTDYGKYVIAVHSNAPNPMHGHEPLELGDIRIYKLLWSLKKTGMGDDHKIYLIFERGGGKDPFARSVEVLRFAVEFLEQNTEPDDLPPEFFGIKSGTAGDIKRQGQIIRDHAYEPLKDLLEMSEEEWTMLSQLAIRKGKKPEAWKKGEFK